MVPPVKPTDRRPFFGCIFNAPPKGNLMTRLEKITHLVLMFVAVAALSIVIDRQYFHSQRHMQPQYLVGTNIALSQVQWSADKYNVVLVISAECRFCIESAPFYHSLGELADRVNLVIVSHDDRASLDRFLESQRISAKEEVTSASLSEIGVRGTPTVLLIDKKGIVKRVFAGKQPSKVEDGLLSDLREGRL